MKEYYKEFGILYGKEKEIEDLNKKYNIIYKYEILDSYGFLDKYLIITFDKIYAGDDENDIELSFNGELINDIISNHEEDIAIKKTFDPSVDDSYILDGTCDKIYFRGESSHYISINDLPYFEDKDEELEDILFLNEELFDCVLKNAKSNELKKILNDF